MNHTLLLNRLFYCAKPHIPRSTQIFLRRQIACYKHKRCADLWPIDERVGHAPEGWKGWPGGKRFAVVLSHDVDTQAGHDKCLELAEMEQKLGFCSSFNFVPERYPVSAELRRKLTHRGFEVAVHGLKHDGKLYLTRNIFQKRARRINTYLEKWGSVGFHSPSMHRNLEWTLDLNIEYDQSTFDTDPFEPQPDGIGTIFPFWVSGNGKKEGYVELPYTLPQDFTLFILLGNKGVDIWKRKLEWISKKGGMALLNTHPDYMNFNGNKLQREEYPARNYKEFLHHLNNNYTDQYWHALPKDMARFWRQTVITPPNP